MAKSINPYQGQAPTAMAQMGQGLSEAGANIGRSLQQGYQSLGQGLAGGINTAVNEYAKYKDMKSQIKASEKSYDTIKDYLDPKLREKFDNEIKLVNTDTSLSTQDKAAFWDQAKSTLGNFVSQGFKATLQKNELDAAAARQSAQIEAQQMQPYIEGSSKLLYGSPVSSENFTPESLQISSPQKKTTKSKFLSGF